MKKPESLREVTSNTLGGLQAGPDMKAKILIAAAEQKTAGRSSLRHAAISVLSLAAAAAVCIGFLRLSPADTAPAIRTTAAGSEMTDGRLQAELQPGSVVLTAGSTASSYGSIWAPVSGGYFPLVCVNGQYYRLLRNPTSVTGSLKGDALGTVVTKTSEPALCGEAVFSNTVEAGETVYALRGMKGAAVIANVNGTDRAFQRVSFNGSAMLGGEGFADTIKIAGHVTGMELSGVGTITDGTALSALTDTLLSKSSLVSAGGSPDGAPQTLLISLDNGIALQLAVRDATLIACGSWSNPAFIQAFAAACP